MSELNSINSLFDSVHYQNDIQLDTFITNMNDRQAIYCLIESAKAAYRRGAFKIEESEAISKAIRVLGG